MKSSAQDIDVIIPTFNNPQQLHSCLMSLDVVRAITPFRIIVVNNGDSDVAGVRGGDLVLKPRDNLGWTGGLHEALKHSKAKYVVFANDDIVIPASSKFILRDFKRLLEMDEKVGAVGPISNCVMGQQNMWNHRHCHATKVQFLIGFFKMLKRSALDDIGGVDPTFATGDDIDESIRFALKGYDMLCSHMHFVFHHGFQTGERVYGSPNKPGGWNSQQMSEETNANLIRKHGFLNWWKCMSGQLLSEDEVADVEGDCIRDILKDTTKDKKIVELGCGGQLTIPGSVGYDRVQYGDPIPHLDGVKSVATITGDIEELEPEELPELADIIIARHILEHCVDIVSVLQRMDRCLNEGGLLVLALPNDKYFNTIPLNPEHKHAFTPSSMYHLMEALGFEDIGIYDKYSVNSFIITGRTKIWL